MQVKQPSYIFRIIEMLREESHSVPSTCYLLPFYCVPRTVSSNHGPNNFWLVKIEPWLWGVGEGMKISTSRRYHSHFENSLSVG